MNLTMDKVLRKYVQLRHEVERIEAERKAMIANIKTQMLDLETWLTVKAQEEGLQDIKVKGVGTGYWATHSSATVAIKDVFMEYVREHNAYDLVDARANKTAVKAFIEEHNEPPPGVNFASIRVFNVREAKGDSE